MASRPEHTAPPEIFYGVDEAAKYTRGSRVRQIQAQLTERAIELLQLSNGPKFILDVGCGSGLSGEVLTENGHVWVGLDISPAMLDVAVDDGVVEDGAGDLILSDAGCGMMFRPGSFDGCISISAIQWLCNADKSWHNPKKRLNHFFETLYMVLAKGARAVLQFYPENSKQMELITSAATKAGFAGGLVVDYPNSTRAKKYYLVLTAGSSYAVELPKARTEVDDLALDEDDDSGGPRVATVFDRKRKQMEREQERARKRRGGRDAVKSRNWVLQKKAHQRNKGLEVRPDTKYTARKRKDKF